jgi:hypothetical protein
MKRFNVVIPKEDGGVELYPMKEWLRQHPDQLPGWDPNSNTSHQLRDAFKKKGWSVQDTGSEVRLIMPGTANLGTNVVGAVLGCDDVDQEQQPEAAFALEYQLRDFLAQNLTSIPVEGKKLRLYVDPTGRDGIEYPTAVGPIGAQGVPITRLANCRATWDGSSERLARIKPSVGLSSQKPSLIA